MNNFSFHSLMLFLTGARITGGRDQGRDKRWERRPIRKRESVGVYVKREREKPISINCAKNCVFEAHSKAKEDKQVSD